MKVMVLPLALIFLPMVCLYFWSKYSERVNHFSFLAKSIIAILFMVSGLVLSYFAILLSIEGMGENGIQCMTGIVFFIPVAFFANVIGVPVLLFFKRDWKFIQNRKSHY